MEKLLEIYQKYEEDLHDYLVGELERFEYDVTSSPSEYIVAIPKEQTPIMLVAHIDTVHKTKPTNKTIIVNNDVIASPTTGLGADDRNGIYGILRLLELGYRPQVLFTHDEEIGGLGAKAFTIDYKKPLINTKFLIELDRKGINDCVFYDCGNKKFQGMISSYGFVDAWGSFTDVDVISRVWDVASVNLSIGYYNAHMKSEFTLFSGIEFTLNRVQRILDDETELEFYNYQEIVKAKYTYKPKTSNNKFKIGDKIIIIGEPNTKWDKYKKGEIYTVKESYYYGCYVKGNGHKSIYIKNEKAELYIETTSEDEKELEEIKNDMIVYGYTVSDNKKVIDKIKDLYDCEYDKDMKLWHIMEKVDDVS